MMHNLSVYICIGTNYGAYCTCTTNKCNLFIPIQNSKAGVWIYKYIKSILSIVFSGHGLI